MIISCSMNYVHVHTLHNVLCRILIGKISTDTESSIFLMNGWPIEI